MRLAMCLAAAVCAAAQVPATNPFDTAAGIAEGRALFQTHCAVCHGARGEGGRGADLTTGQYRRGGSDGLLYITIREGIPGTEMPAVRVSDDDVLKMVAFVKRIPAASFAEKAPGDPVAGKAVFEGKAACARCHAIGLTGGSLGPDLTAIGRRRNLKNLEESIVNPAADVDPRFRTVQLTTRSGQKAAGIRINEDDLSIQLRDLDDNLRSWVKADLRDLRYDGPTPMPAFAKTLTRKEVEDVVAYLSTLRGPQ